MLNKIEFHPENGNSKWINRVGKNNCMWFAYSTLFKAILKFPSQMWKFRNMG